MQDVAGRTRAVVAAYGVGAVVWERAAVKHRVFALVHVCGTARGLIVELYHAQCCIDW